MKPRFLQRISHSSRLNCFENSRSSKCVGGFSTSAYLGIIVDLLSSKTLPLASFALCVVTMHPDLLGREQPFEILDNLGWSEIFLSLITVGKYFSLLIDDDQARNTPPGILLKR